MTTQAALIQSIEFNRARLNALDTEEQRQAVETSIRDSLTTLDNLLWAEHEPGETVAACRARMLPGFDW